MDASRPIPSGGPRTHCSVPVLFVDCAITVPSVAKCPRVPGEIQRLTSAPMVLCMNPFGLLASIQPWTVIHTNSLK